MLDMPLFLLGLNVQASGPPAWLPSWADSGVSYENNQAYFGGTLITDLSTIHAAATAAGGFVQGAVSGAGIAILTGNTCRPQAAGAFLARMATLNFTFAIHFDTSADSPVGTVGVVLLVTDANGTGGGLVCEWGSGTGSLTCADFNNASFDEIGIIEISKEYKVCGANTAGGWLSSLNGNTAVLITPHSVETVTEALIGFESPNSAGGNHMIEGHVRSIFFGPVTSVAATIQARATL